MNLFPRQTMTITYGVKGNLIRAKTKNQMKIVELSNKYDMFRCRSCRDWENIY